MIPQGQVIRRLTLAIDLESELVGKSGPRDIQPLPAQIEIVCMEITHIFIDLTRRRRFHDIDRRRTLDLDHARMGVGYRNVVSFTMGDEPGFQRAIRLHIPVAIGGDSEQNAIHEHTALRRAGDAIPTTPFL